MQTNLPQVASLSDLSLVILIACEAAGSREAPGLLGIDLLERRGVRSVLTVGGPKSEAQEVIVFLTGMVDHQIPSFLGLVKAGSTVAEAYTAVATPWAEWYQERNAYSTGLRPYARLLGDGNFRLDPGT